MNQHLVPGLAVAIVHACLESPTPCTGSTPFDIASSSKSLTAAAVGILVADNDRYPEMQYDATMSSLLPEDFVMPGVGYTEGVTLDDVLSHRAGMASDDCSYMSPRAEQPDDARSVTRNLRNLTVAASIRARYLYCNMMFTVTTHLVEVKTKQSFSDFLKDCISRPLNMESTSLQPTRARAKGLGDRIATGYHWGKGENSGYRTIQSLCCPEAPLLQARMTSSNIYKGLVRMRSFVNPSGRSLRRFTSPAVYAAGLEINYYRGHMIVGHDGAISGFGSRFFFLPDFKFGAVVMGNSSGVGAVSNAICRRLVDAVLKVPEAESQPQSHSEKKETPAKEEENGANNPRSNQIPATRGRENTTPSGVTPNGLHRYLDRHWHPGYRLMTLQIRNEKPFIDNTDRSMGFTMAFQHVCDQTKYTAYLGDMFDGGEDSIRAEFAFEHGRISKMGLDLEPVAKELIWFEYVGDRSSRE
ncbi:beta-lactamase/transpeptidase-like protein [Xylaria acuta]|nr:beta-lactamase/transpeptidase-like protein [Xylaria acuta]